MNPKICFIFLLYTILTACNNHNQNSSHPDFDKSYFKIADIDEPYGEVLYDTESDLIYVISRNENGEMFTYNYKDFAIEAAGVKGDYFILDYPVCFGEYRGVKELLIGDSKSVNIYDARTLAFKDNFRVFSDLDRQNIASLDFMAPDLIFVGACNTISVNGDRGTLVYNRNDFQFIGRAGSGEQCQRVKAFFKESEKNEIGLFGIGFQSSNPSIIIDRYSIVGEVLESKAVHVSPEYYTSPGVLASNDIAQYFITGRSGNIYNKYDGTYLATLEGEYEQFFLSEDAQKIYAVEDPSSIAVFDYPTLNRSGTIRLADGAVKDNVVPATLFIDEKSMILIYLSYQDVYLSVIDLPDL